MKMRLLKVAATFLFLASLSSSCIVLLGGQIARAKAEKTITVDNGQLPHDYMREHDGTLVLLKRDEKSYDKYLFKHFTKHYEGKFILLTEKELEMDKYSDTQEYRYVISMGKVIKQVRIPRYYTKEVNGKNQQVYDDGKLYTTRFTFQDKLMGKNYVCAYTSGYYGKFMVAYAKNLAALRKKNREN